MTMVEFFSAAISVGDLPQTVRQLDHEQDSWVPDIARFSEAEHDTALVPPDDRGSEVRHGTHLLEALAFIVTWARAAGPVPSVPSAGADLPRCT
ncbi:hypothetical protein [Streptomyces sp. 142MFCol3.1]|uniref:hypothetical protein n=1 Tax=Streptomyces sp. 142MFCol3.1 TaxID=1172179 RepID=UPI00048F9011|nr:hypothetical protein [Streptomyces sp. 142MFCol3.1]